MAKTLFGTANPIGETFLAENRQLMEVVAVYKDFPKNSSFWEYKMITPLIIDAQFTTWMNAVYETFCLLPEKADTAQVSAKMRKAVTDATNEGWWYYPVLQRLDEIHLHSAKFHRSYTSSQSDIEKVKMLSLLAVIILVVACINYMNLSTARAQKRSREIGISKTLGAKRHELITRLYLESGIFTFVSFVAAFILFFMLLPTFNNLLGEQLQFVLAFRPLFVFVALLIWLITTFVAASYPALYLSGFPPLMAIRQSSISPKSSHAVVRKVLSIGQFAVAIVLIAWVLTIQAQIRFMNNKDLGYNPEKLMYITAGMSSRDTDLGPLVNDLKAESSVEMVSRHSSPFFSGQTVTIAKDPDDHVGLSVTMQAADPDFIDIMQMKLIAGRPLPEWRSGDTIIQVILNRAAVEYIEMTPEEVIGKRVRLFNYDANEVCGVVENFNFESLHSPVRGFGFHNIGMWPKSVIMLQLKEGNLSEQLTIYEQIFKRHFPNEMFEPKFLDLEVANAYAGERRTNQVAIVFSILAIFVACMGVFGLTAFMAEQRTKEIGIRKVMGASVLDIITLFTNSYTKLLAISLVIAIPVAWWVCNEYLQGFAYRISIAWWIFVAAALITVVLTLLTVCIQAIKSALINPVEAIKTE
jgi:ABC-type antimicrobial peptide transport system permease subunit